MRLPWRFPVANAHGQNLIWFDNLETIRSDQAVIWRTLSVSFRPSGTITVGGAWRTRGSPMT
jgi:hypothetical protein